MGIFLTHTVVGNPGDTWHMHCLGFLFPHQQRTASSLYSKNSFNRQHRSVFKCPNGSNCKFCK